MNHAHLSKRIFNRGTPRPGGGMGTGLFAGTVEPRQRRDECADSW